MQYFEDIRPGDIVTGPTYTGDRDEIVEFAHRWDPQPFHLDEAAADDLFGEGGATAPGVFKMKYRSQT